MQWFFLGYDDDFYDAIPWVKIDTEGMDPPFPNDGFDIDSSFIRIATKLKFRRDNEKVYAEYGLPEDETVRAAVLDSPELLFYAPELARLFGMITKPELILKLIEGDRILCLLSELHRFPGILEFIEFYNKYADQEEIADYLIDYHEGKFQLLAEAAKSYGVMDEKRKARAEKLLRASPCQESLLTVIYGFPYSEPIITRYRHEWDRRINGFYFKRIASDRDLRLAEKYLGRPNCFDDVSYMWRTDIELYAVHTEDSDYAVVLEVENYELQHIHRSLYARYSESELLAAILQWMIEAGYTMGRCALNET